MGQTVSTGRPKRMHRPWQLLRAWRGRSVTSGWPYLLAAALLAAWLASQPALRALDRQLHDTLTRLQPQRPAPSHITLIDIDEASLRALGPWPWPRPLLAQLASNLRQRGVSLQIWDLALPEATLQDQPLAFQLAQPDIVVGQIPILDPTVQPAPQDGTLVATHTGLPCSTHPPVTGHIGLGPGLQHAQVGHIAATPDADGRLRTLPAQICNQGHSYPQLIVAAAQAANPAQAWQVSPGQWPWEPAQWWQRGTWRLALDAQGQIHIPYQRVHNAWPAISAHLLLDNAAPLTSMAGHTVLLGTTALGLADVAASPYHPRAPGVSVHAELLAAALGQQPWVNQPVRALPWLAALMTLLLGAALLPLARQSRTHVLWLGAPLALASPALVAVLVRVGSSSLPVAAPTLTLLLLLLALAIAQAHQQRQTTLRLTHHLQSFLPPALATQVAAQVPSGESLGQPCTGLVLGLYLAGLDKWVSSVDSLQALALTHALHASAHQVAQAHGGQLAQAQGSHLYIAWPDASPASAHSAWACANSLRHALAPVLQQNESTHRPLSLYLALEQGSYLLGLVGGRNSRRTVLLGPVVNEIVGMLDLCAELASAFVIGPQAAASLRHSMPSVPLQSLGSFLLPDIAQQRTLYRAPT